MSELKNDKLIQKWFSKRKLTNNSRISYLQAMQEYTEFTGKSPLELILEAESEIKAGLLLREQKIDSYLPEFREMLESRGLAPLSVRNKVTGVASFYRSNGIILPELPRSSNESIHWGKL